MTRDMDALAAAAERNPALKVRRYDALPSWWQTITARIRRALARPVRVTDGFECRGCNYTQDVPFLSEAVRHALTTRHTLVHQIDADTTATVSVTEADHE